MSCIPCSLTGKDPSQVDSFWTHFFKGLHEAFRTTVEPVWVRCLWDQLCAFKVGLRFQTVLKGEKRTWLGLQTRYRLAVFFGGFLAELLTCLTYSLVYGPAAVGQANRFYMESLGP
ncbi:MAG: hypothetical protein BJ554DRAFT_7054 [Olpidium bornovanus]|uniref:Uncharacterized protein n=1 Tax=Olpidium bornovanus TaxID=278681 RepID=A0A8H7ZXA5_9FUNG|nr:MAG: hypothetical protein BJ554DRAFT_7054 [Olpidium bornovanus]